VEPYRESIEDFIRRYGRVLAVAVAVLLALLVLRRLRVLTVPVLIGAILVVGGWLLLSSPATSGLTPSISTQTSVDRNDVVWACGRKVLPGYRGIPREARNDFAEVRKDFALVTTMSPSAIWYSMVTSAQERAAWNSAVDLLYSSRLEPWPGSKLRSVKSGASSSSIVSRFLLTKASSKRRAKALFFSSSDDTGASSSLPTCVSLAGQQHP
jgi:hypothetical protein